MKNSKKALTIALAAVLACGTLAGCDALTTTDLSKDFNQVIAEVDLTRSEEFQGNGKYAKYASFVGKSEIVKRDMVASYISSGYSVQNQYNWSYSDIFGAICDSLINRQVYVQYAKVYLAENGGLNGETYGDAAKYAEEAAKGKSQAEKDANGLAYFLTDDEENKALYDLRVSVNNSIDSIEEGIIDLADEEETSSVTVRTLPTGADSENEDYFATAETYKIYTGAAETLSEGYEKVEGSLPYTRSKAYTQFLANLRANNLIEKGENVNDFENMNYFQIERKSAFESAIIEKLGKKLEQEAEKTLLENDGAWIKARFDKAQAADRSSYANDKSAFESAFEGISDSSFVFSAPETTENGETVFEKYGFVINILLPFSTLQTQQLNELSADIGDAKGNKFAARTELLKKIKATDQRGTWFTGEDDHSYLATSGYGYAQGEREYLFFEDSVANSGEGKKYEPLKNYYGQYTYNGKVTPKEKDGKTTYILVPNPIDIDGFLGEMTGYLNSVDGLTVTMEKAADYYTKGDYYGENGKVNYERFVYAKGSVTGDGAYNINNVFDKTSWENKAFSVINELSFAYNTDTAGLNTYLGYMISPFKTDYMAEFEYAAQEVVALGGGHFAVVPTDYGWHIIYCTFSYADDVQWEFDFADIEKEGTFSYNYFEAIKSELVTSYSNDVQTEAIDLFVDDCSTIYEDRFADLTGLDSRTA